MFGEYPFATMPVGTAYGPPTMVSVIGTQIQIQLGCYHVSAWAEITDPSTTWSSVASPASAWGQITVTTNVWNEVC